MKTKVFSLCLAAAVSGWVSTSTGAELRTWTGAGADNNWSTPENWSTGVPATWDAADFAGAAGLFNNNDLTGLSLGGLRFSNGDFELLGNGLIVTGAITNLAGNNLLGTALTLDAPKDWLVLAGSELRVTSNTSGTGSGGGTVQLSGGGVLRISGASTWSRGLDITNGTIVLDGATLSIASDGVRFRAGDREVARLVLTNDANLTISGGGNLRMPNSGHVNGVNILDVYSGSVILNGSGRSIFVGDTANLSAEINQYGGRVATEGPATELVLGSASGAKGTYNLNGGILEVTRVRRNSSLATTLFNFNGGTLKARTNGVFLDGLTGAFVLDGGAVIDTDVHDLTVPQNLQANGAGGLTKKGLGALHLTGTTGYQGPTVIEAGTLSMKTSHAGQGGITCHDGTTLNLKVPYAGSSLNVSELVLGSNTTFDQVNLNLDLGSFGNPTKPVIQTSHFAYYASVLIRISGTGLTQGRIPLVKYDTSDPLAFLDVDIQNLPPGVNSVFLIENFETSTLDLIIDSAQSLTWTGASNDQWDINTSLNWIDSLSGQEAVYAQATTPGEVVRFDDSASVTNVNISSFVSPAGVIVTNEAVDYVFSGFGLLSGEMSLTKLGSGSLTLNNFNLYSGATLIYGGTVRMGSANGIPFNATVVLADTPGARLDLNNFSQSLAWLDGGGPLGGEVTLGTGNLTLNGTQNSTFAGTLSGSGALIKQGANTVVLTGANLHSGGTTVSGGWLLFANENSLGSGPIVLGGGSLAPIGGAARVLTNTLSQLTTATLGEGTNNGDLTLEGEINFNNGARNLTLNCNTTFASAQRNGGLSQKLGPGILTITGDGQWSSSSSAVDVEIRESSLVIDGGSLAIDGALRIMSTLLDGVSYVTVNNSGSLAITRSNSNLRVGYSNGNSSATNIVEIGGPVTLVGGGSGGRVQLGTSCARAVVNLLPGGVLETEAIEHSGNVSEFNFDGGTLRALNDELGSTFMEGLTEVYVRDGGAIIDTAGWNITIAQALQAGGTGGLTKQGAGTLTLAGANTYAGPTLVNGGRVFFTAAQPPGGTVDVSDGAGIGVLRQGVGDRVQLTSLTLGSAAGAAVDFRLGGFGNPANAPLHVNNLVANGAVSVNIVSGNISPGTFPLLTYDSIGGGANFVRGTLPQGVEATVVHNEATRTIELQVTAVAPIVWTGAASGNWDINASTNWQTAGAPTVYFDGDNVLFDESATGSKSVNLATVLRPSSVVVSNSASSYTFSGAGRISGGASLIKNGNGALAISTANDFAGPVTIKAGTLYTGHGSALGTTDSGTVIEPGATLDVSGQNLGAESITVAGAGMNGNGALVNNGAAPQQNALRFVTLAGDTTFGGQLRWDIRSDDPVALPAALMANGYSLIKTGYSYISLFRLGETDLGDITVNQGFLEFAYTSTMGDPAKSLGIGPTAGISFWDTGTNVLAKNLVMTNATIYNTTGNNVFDGPVALIGNNTFNVSSSLELRGWLSDAGALNKVGGGTLILATNNSYAGGTLVGGGILQIGKGGPQGSAGTGAITNNGTLRFDRSDDFNWTNEVVAGSGSLGQFIKENTNTMTLRATNQYLSAGAGAAQVNDGSLIIDPAGTMVVNREFWVAQGDTTARCLVAGGTLVVSNWIAAGRNHSNAVGEIVLAGGAMVKAGGGNVIMGSLGGTGTLTVNDGILQNNSAVLLGENSGNGYLNLNGGVVQASQVAEYNSGGISLVNFNGGILQAIANHNNFLAVDEASIQAGGLILDDGGFTLTNNQALLEDTNSPGGGLKKLGAGTVFFDGVSTYTGPTVVSNGTLAGSGTLASPVTIAAQGALAPGAGIGTLTIANTLEVQGRVVAQISVSTGLPAADLITGLSTITYGGTLIVTNIDAEMPTEGQVFKLFEAANYNGAFARMALPELPAGLTWDVGRLGTDGTIRVVAVAQVQFANWSVSGTELVLSGTGGTPGGDYYVLGSSNVVVPPANWTILSTNAFDANGNFSVTNVIDPAWPRQFYLLQVP